MILVGLGIGVGTYEFFEILEARGLHPYKTLGVLAALILGLSTYFRNYLAIFVTFTALLFFLAITELTRKNPDRAIYHISTTVFGTFYVGWLMSHLILLREMPVALHRDYDYGIGATYALLPFLLAWSNDTAAYFVGGKFGKHQLIPRVSPKKTWEGTVGGAVFSIIMCTHSILLPEIFCRKMKNVAILGSTGSIGRATLEVIAHLKDSFKVFAMSANRNVLLLEEQIEKYEPEIICITDREAIKRLKPKSGLVLLRQ